jgi:hypothetical protein
MLACGLFLARRWSRGVWLVSCSGVVSWRVSERVAPMLVESLHVGERTVAMSEIAAAGATEEPLW